MINELGRSEAEVKPILDHGDGVIHEDMHNLSDLNIRDMNSINKTTRIKASVAFHDDIHGIGADEDTIGSCVSVHPLPPRKDLLRWMKFGDLQL